MEYLFRNMAAEKWDGTNGSAVIAMANTVNFDGSYWSIVEEINGVHLKLQQWTATGFSLGTVQSIFPGSPWVVITSEQVGLFARLADDGQYQSRFLKASEVVPVTNVVPSRSFNNAATRSLVTGTGATGFQVSATRDAMVGYNVTMSSTATIGGASNATVVLEICATNSATPGDWVEISRLTNGQTITLAIVLQSVQAVAGQLSGIIPAGYYAKLRTVITGTASATFNTGQEVML